MRDIDLSNNEVFKVVITSRRTDAVTSEFGPYGTVGAAKGRLTSYLNSYGRSQAYGGYVASIKGEWAVVEGTEK